MPMSRILGIWGTEQYFSKLPLYLMKRINDLELYFLGSSSLRNSGRKRYLKSKLGQYNPVLDREASHGFSDFIHVVQYRTPVCSENGARGDISTRDPRSPQLDLCLRLALDSRLRLFPTQD